MLLEVLTTSITLENKLFIQRDLKSSKILFGEDMHAQLLDFELVQQFYLKEIHVKPNKKLEPLDIWH